MIKEAAILLVDGTILTGKRHGEIFRKAKDDNFSVEQFKGHVQGFVDDKNKFYNRKDSGKIAYECGQIKEIINCLMSEDLYWYNKLVKLSHNSLGIWDVVELTGGSLWTVKNF